jgi:hypothetical protein
MIEYLYFVKFENDINSNNPFDWEEDVFETFNDAKDFAESLMSKHPEIHQTEIIRNDFGECVDSNDLGMIWSWKEAMSDIPDTDETTFSKSDTFDSDIDSEFEYTDDDIVFETDCVVRNKPLPADMTIEALIEEMEENEDQVECKWCEDLFDKSDCKCETSLGWLCPQCQEALISRGEQLTFKSSNCQEALKETFSPKETVELYYPKLYITMYGEKRDVDDWDEKEITTDFTYEVSMEDVATLIWEDYLTDEDVADVPGGFDALEDDAAWNKFLETHFDDLFSKYEKQILAYYEDDAKEACEEYLIYNGDDIGYNESKKNKSKLDKLEESEDYKKRLTMCPECGSVSYDLETGICINCGFNCYSSDEDTLSEDMTRDDLLKLARITKRIIDDNTDELLNRIDEVGNTVSTHHQAISKELDNLNK